MALSCQHSCRQLTAAKDGQRQCRAFVSKPAAVSTRALRRHLQITHAAATDAPDSSKTIAVRTKDGDLPFPYSERDPYKLPISIEKVQKLLASLGWEKPWVEQIVDRIMKNMLKTTEDRTQGVIAILGSIGLRQDEICNMASISVVLLGLNPDTRIKPVIEYLRDRGVPMGSIADLVLKHPRIFEYKLTPSGKALAKGAARIKVDTVPTPSGEVAVAINYFRENAAFLQSPVSPMPPSEQ